MKYLLFSDIHGCLPALEKVLDFFEAEHCDMMCIMGDIINYGPRNRIPEGIDPKGIVERLNALADKIIAVRGNCDAGRTVLHSSKQLQMYNHQLLLL